MDHDPPSLTRRRVTAALGSATALSAGPAAWLLAGGDAQAQSTSQSRVERMAAQLSVVTRSTMAGVVAFLVPGNDLYSLAQGRYSLLQGGVAAKGDAFLVYMFNNYLPLPGAETLATQLGRPFEQLRLPRGDGTTVSLGQAVQEVLSTTDSVPLSTLLGLLLNALALTVQPTAALNLLLPPFCALSWTQKARVLELLELPGSEALRMISERIQEPVTRTLVGYVQLIGLGLLAFAGSGSYSEWAVLDPARRTLTAKPVGWTLSRYQGVSDGWNEFRGYYQGRRSASDA
jgi:hypothetical protein